MTGDGQGQVREDGRFAPACPTAARQREGGGQPSAFSLARAPSCWHALHLTRRAGRSSRKEAVAQHCPGRDSAGEPERPAADVGLDRRVQRSE